MDDSGGEKFYQRVEDLNLSEQELEQGEIVEAKGSSRDHKVKLSRVVVSTRCTGWTVTDDLFYGATRGAQQRQPHTACWRIEEFHREAKQSTCIELYQCRIGRVQHNYLACVVLAWLHLKYLVHQSGQTTYRIKRELLYDYLVRQLENPTVQMLLE